MSPQMNQTCIEILKKLRRSDSPLSLEEMFESITPAHFKAIQHLTQVAESVETVHTPNTTTKYQLR